MTADNDIQSMFTSEERGWLTRGLQAQLEEIEQSRAAVAATYPTKEQWVKAGWRPDYGPAAIQVDRAERLQALMERFGCAPK